MILNNILYGGFMSFSKIVISESFKDLKIILRDPKLLIISFVVLFVNTQLTNHYMITHSFLVVILSILITLPFNTYQYYRIGRLIQTKQKKIIENKYKGFGTRLGQFIKAILVFTLVSLGLATSISIIAGIIFFIVYKIGFFQITLFLIFKILLVLFLTISMIVFLIRTLLFVPLSILNDTMRPINLSLELTKGYFWRLSLNILVPVIFGLLNMIIVYFLSPLLGPNSIILNIITLPLNVISINMYAIILINSMYYVMNKDSENIVQTDSSFEAI